MKISRQLQRYSITISLILVISLAPSLSQARNFEQDKYRYSHKYNNSYKYKNKYHYNYGYGHKYRRNYYPIGYRIHSLPRGYVSFSFSGYPYYFHAGTYYRPYNNYYRVVSSPYYYGYPATYHSGDHYYDDEDDYSADHNVDRKTSRVSQSYVYPVEGQNADRVQQDKYECYVWASGQTGYDPARIKKVNYSGEAENYQRAKSACLEARGYSVK